MGARGQPVTVVIKQKGKPPFVFKGERFEANTPDGALGLLVQRTGPLPWCDPCTINGKQVPLDSDYQLAPGDKLVVRVK